MPADEPVRAMANRLIQCAACGLISKRRIGTRSKGASFTFAASVAAKGSWKRQRSTSRRWTQGLPRKPRPPPHDHSHHVTANEASGMRDRVGAPPTRTGKGQGDSPVTTYARPMHPQIGRPTPGKCKRGSPQPGRAPRTGLFPESMYEKRPDLTWLKVGGGIRGRLDFRRQYRGHHEQHSAACRFRYRLGSVSRRTSRVVVDSRHRRHQERHRAQYLHSR